MDWTKNARLAHFEATDAVTEAKMTGNHAAVIKLGTGLDLSPNSADQLDLVVRAYNRPAAGFYTVDFRYINGISDNPNAYPKPGDQNEWTVTALDRALFMGGVYGNPKRKYSALIIDVSQVEYEPGKILTPSWLWKFGIQHLGDMLWKRYRLPIYFYITPLSYQKMGGSPELREHFASLTQDNALSSVRFSGTDATLYPPANAKPREIDMPEGAERRFLLDSGPWWLWLYFGNPYLWLYNGTPKQLYEAWGWTEAPATQPEPEPEPEPDEEPTTPSAVLQQIAAMRAQMEADHTQTMAAIEVIRHKLFDEIFKV